MKAPLPAIACIVFASSFLISCSSEPTEGERASAHAKDSDVDPDLDSDLDNDPGSVPAKAEKMNPAKASASEMNKEQDDLDSAMSSTPPNPQGASTSMAPLAEAPDAMSTEPVPMEDMAAHPRTKYQVLQNGFDHATRMPTVNDFDPLDDPSPRLMCLSTKAAAPDSISEVVIKQMMVQIGGVADYGPLFPGSLDHVETRLIIGRNNGWVNSQNLSNEMRQVFELARAPGSLVIKINPNSFGIYQDIGAPAEVWMRKDARGHLFFKVYRLDAQRNRTEVFLGYCFQRGLTPSVIPSSAQ